MLDLGYIERHPETAANRLHSRGDTLEAAKKTIVQLLAANQERKRLQQEMEAATIELKHREHAFREAIDTDRAALRLEIAQKREAHKSLSKLYKEVEATIEATLVSLPNLPDPQVPIGRSAADNVVIKTGGATQAPAEPLEPHWVLLKRYKLANFEQGAHLTGAGFPVYHSAGARLQRGLIQYFLDKAVAAGYEEVQPPLLVNRASALGTGQLPDKEGMMYELEGSKLYLIPTAEVPLTNLYRGALLSANELPLCHTAYTPCFRREAGSWGRHVRGLNRLHQFDKVELVRIEREETWEAALAGMLRHVETLLEALGLRYRLLKLCTGDLGAAAALTYDFEVWSPGQQQWLEVSSVSAFGTYQSRRMRLRYRAGGANLYCHTLNGSALALPRILAALLEQGQQPDHIMLPTALHPYLPFERIT